jgi:hypothetical protein
MDFALALESPDRFIQCPSIGARQQSVDSDRFFLDADVGPVRRRYYA